MIKTASCMILVVVLAASAAAADVTAGPFLNLNRSCMAMNYTGQRAGPDDQYGGSPFDASRGRQWCDESRDAVTLVGAGVSLAVSGKSVTFRCAPTYLRRGFDFLRSTRHEHRVRLDFLEVPLQLMVCISCRSSRLYIFGGPTLGVRLRDPDEDVYISYFVVNTPQRQYDERRDKWRRLNAGVSLGIGLQLGSRRLAPFAEIEYAHGLVDAYEGVNIRDATRDVQVRLGVSLRMRQSKRGAELPPNDQMQRTKPAQASALRR